jgi:hypothetical protein
MVHHCSTCHLDLSNRSNCVFGTSRCRWCAIVQHFRNRDMDLSALETILEIQQSPEVIEIDIEDSVPNPPASMPIESNRCAICLECIQSRCVLVNCNHPYCEGCIKRWTLQRIRDGQPIQCPECRTSYESVYTNIQSAEVFQEIDIQQWIWSDAPPDAPPEPILNIPESIVPPRVSLPRPRVSFEISSGNEIDVTGTFIQMLRGGGAARPL